MLAERYEILEQLGQGGMGAVYKVHDRELDRIVALKTIRPDLASNTSTIRRFKQELLLARQISHRNVIRIYDLGVSGGLRFITMEFVDGRDLRSLLREHGKLTPEEAAGIVKQICAGLEAAHAEDVIHRDLKPQNILLDRQGQVRIMDFGLARTLEQSGITGTGMIVGTADYMSPEQARGEQIDARSDLFSLGLILYELLTGVLPFAAESIVSTLFRRTQERAEPVQAVDPSIPSWIARITMRCLEPDAAERYQSAAEIAYDLEHPDADPLRRPVSSAGEFAPGALLGSRYRIEAKAGEGGMGVVYRATDLELNRTVALKIIRPELTADPRSLERLKQEILLASRISQRNVLRIHDLGEANGLRFISMAWVEGQDLSHLIREHAPLPEDRVIALGRQLCEGLDAAHAEGVVHRDLKPQNILIDAGGNACIGDFGLAQTAAALPENQTVQLAGTPRYMSPEQVEGKAVDQRSDIYSLGLILYEMATGAPAFATDSLFQTMMRRVTEPPKNPKLANPALSDHLAQTILRCLKRDPEKRYPSAREALTALAPPPAAAKPGLPRIYTWSLAAIAAAVIAVLAFAIVHFRGTSTPAKGGKYVAVLPFRSLSADPNLKYEAEGLADAITSRLFALNGVHPISRPALERVDLSKPENTIAHQVGANLVVRGTLQGEGDRIQAIVAIDDVQSNKTIWSKSFPGMRGDLLTIEDDISNQVVAALGITPTSEERARETMAPTQNIAAYDLYLKGRDILKNHRDAKAASEALQLFQEACTKDPSFALAWTGVADASLLTYNLRKESFWAEKALTAAQEASRRTPNLPEVHFALGSVYTATGRNTEAIAEIKRALELAPNSDAGYIRLGKAYLAEGQSEPALAAFQKAVAINPYYWYNHKQLGVAYFELGRNNDALKEFQRQVELNPKGASGYNNLGAIYEQERRWKEAIPQFEKAIALAPSYDAYSNLGTAYYELGRYPDAVAMYQKAVQANPNQATAQRNLGYAYERAGNHAKAAEAFRQTIQLAYNDLEVNPKDTGALQNLALAYSETGENAKGLRLIERARTIDGANKDLMYSEAVIEARNHKLPEALKALEDALRNGYSVEDARADADLKKVVAMPEFQTFAAEFGQAVK